MDTDLINKSSTAMAKPPLVCLETVKYCKFGNFARVLFSRNIAYAKFRENIILAKWQNYSLID